MNQQGNLEVGHYVRPVPASNSYNPKRRYRRCSLCCCIFTTIVSLIILSGIFVLIAWLVLQPKVIDVAVDDAKLSTFNLTSTTLSYDLSTDITITNPNTKIGVYYHRFEVDSYYAGYRFDYIALPPFYQSTQNTQFLVQHSSRTSLVDSNYYTQFVDQYNKDNNSGSFGVELWIYGTRRLKVGGIAGSRGKLRVRCDLTVPLTGSSALFSRTKCNVVGFL